MTAIFTALVTACLLSLLFQSTRLVGIVCVALITYLFPVPSLAILLLAGIAFLLFLLL